MAMLAAIPFRLGLLSGGSEVVLFLQKIFAYMIIINLSLMIFNLIPIPPLDGSRILSWLLPRQLAQEMDRLERFAGPMLIIVAFLIARLLPFSQITMWLLQLLMW